MPAGCGVLASAMLFFVSVLDLWNESQVQKKKKKTKRVMDSFGTPERRRKPVTVTDILLFFDTIISERLNIVNKSYYICRAYISLEDL